MTLALSSTVLSSVTTFSLEWPGSTLCLSGQGPLLNCGWLLCTGQSTMRPMCWYWMVTCWRWAFLFLPSHNILTPFSVNIWLHWLNEPTNFTCSYLHSLLFVMYFFLWAWCMWSLVSSRPHTYYCWCADDLCHLISSTWQGYMVPGFASCWPYTSLGSGI